MDKAWGFHPFDHRAKSRSLDLIYLTRTQSRASKLGYDGAIPRVLAADTHYPRRAGLSSAARTSACAARQAWKSSAPDTMTDYAADCLSHERHDSVICLIVAISLILSEFRTVETKQIDSSKRRDKFWKVRSVLRFIQISKITIKLFDTFLLRLRYYSFV